MSTIMSLIVIKLCANIVTTRAMENFLLSAVKHVLLIVPGSYLVSHITVIFQPHLLKNFGSH